MPELVTPLGTLAALELPKRRTSRLSRSFVILHNNDASTGVVISYDSADNLLDSKRAVLPWCSGRIATFTKLPVRVRFPSATPQLQILKTDLLVSIKKLGKLGRGPGFRPRTPFYVAIFECRILKSEVRMSLCHLARAPPTTPPIVNTTSNQVLGLANNLYRFPEKNP